MTSLVLTPQQANTLSTHAFNGPATLVTLGLATEVGPIVAQYPEGQLLIDPDGRVMDEERVGS